MSLTLSVFERAATNRAERETITFEEFCEKLKNPEILDEEPSLERAKEIKNSAGAWSGAVFRDDTRALKNVEGVCVLCFDLDGKDSKGVRYEDLILTLHSYRKTFVLHSTTRSGFCDDGLAKLRLIFPLENKLNPDEYNQLWDRVHRDLSLDADEAARDASRLFYEPIIFKAHEHKYVFECAVYDKLSFTKRQNAFSKSLNGVKVPKHYTEAQRLDLIKNAPDGAKHTELNKHAFALFASRLREGESIEGLPELIRSAMEANSGHVADWNAANRTIEKAQTDAISKHELAQETEPDPLDTVKKEEPSPKLVASAKKKLKEIKKEIADGGDLQKLVYELGRYEPSGSLNEETARKIVLEGWELACKKEKTELTRSDVEAQFEVGFAMGKSNPVGVYEDWRGKLIRGGKEGETVTPGESNVLLLLDHHPDLQDMFRWNVRKRGIEILKETPWGSPRPVPHIFKDQDLMQINPWIAKQLGVGSVASDVVTKGLAQKAWQNEYDSLDEWLEALPKANSTETLELVLTKCFGVEDTPAHRAMSRIFFTSIIQRIKKPGCKVDTVLILSGPQGYKKSTFFRRIFPEYLSDDCFSDSIPDSKDKDMHFALEGLQLVELAELSALTGKTAEFIKHNISTSIATARDPYFHAPRQVPRRAVFCGSTNQQGGYLPDSTGNRRFMPVEVLSKLDEGWLDANRELIWAQALFYLNTVGVWWATDADDELFREAQEGASAELPYYAKIEELLNNPDKHFCKKAGGVEEKDGKIPLLEHQDISIIGLTFVTMEQILKYLDLSDGNQNRMPIGRVMQKLGWKSVRKVINGRRFSVWVKK